MFVQLITTHVFIYHHSCHARECFVGLTQLKENRENTARVGYKWVFQVWFASVCESELNSLIIRRHNKDRYLCNLIMIRMLDF